MKTEEQFYEFFEKKLYPNLCELEKKRKKRLYSSYKKGLPFVVCIILIMIIGMGSMALWPDSTISAVLGGIGTIMFPFCFVWACYCHFEQEKKFRIFFKENIMRQIVDFFDLNLIYNPDLSLTKEEVMDSQMFSRFYNCLGDDLVLGCLGSTMIRFSEVICGGNEIIKGRATRGASFQGLFFISDFNKNFKSRTFIVSDQLGVEANFKNLKRVKLEDPRFEKMFVVYAEDQIEARYILSHSLMQRLINFSENISNNIYISFIHSKMHIAIAYKEDLFEANLGRSSMYYHNYSRYFRDLNLMLSIVDELNLNTRIWSKK